MTPTTPVVMVPGMLCDHDLWAEVGNTLGSPAVHASITGETIADMAEQVLAVAPPSFILCGLSLGAIVGFEVLRLAPDRVTGFCAMSTNAGAPTQAQYESWHELAARTDRGEFDQVVRSTIAPTMFGDADTSSEQFERFVRMAHRVGPTVFRAQLAAQATRIDSSPSLREISCATLVLAAERDALCPPSFHQAIADTIPLAQLESIPGAGHLCTWERPHSVSAAIRDWITTQNLDQPQSQETSCPQS